MDIVCNSNNDSLLLCEVFELLTRTVKRVLSEIMSPDWEPKDCDKNLTEQFRQPDGSCEIIAVVEQVRAWGMDTPPIFFIKASKLNTYAKIIVMENT